MPVSTSDGQYFESAEDHAHFNLFGPGYNEDTDTYEVPKLIRHGDTDLNDKNIIHGWTRQPLNDKGIEQAHEDAKGLKDSNITQVFSSDLPRAQQTANILAKTLGVPVVTNPALRTWDAGNFDGKDSDEDHKAFEKYAHETPDTPPPGGSESFNQFKNRVIDAMVGIPGNSAVVTHSKPIGVYAGWEHAGFPEDRSLHMDTYETARKKKPGTEEELQIPDEVAAAQAASTGAGMLWDKYQQNIVEPSKEAHREHFPHWAGLADMLDPLQLPENAKNAVVGTFHAVNNQRLRMNDIMGKDIGMSPEERHELWNPTNMALDHMALWGVAGAFGKIPAGASGANAFRFRPKSGGAANEGFNIFNDETGQAVGYLNGYYDEYNKVFKVDSLSSYLDTPQELSGGVGAGLNRATHSMGPGIMLAGLRALAIEFPDIEAVSGGRISGYRAAHTFNRDARGTKQVVRIPEYIKEEAKQYRESVSSDEFATQLGDIAKENIKEHGQQDHTAPHPDQSLINTGEQYNSRYNTDLTITDEGIARHSEAWNTASQRERDRVAYPNSGGQVPLFYVSDLLHDITVRAEEMYNSNNGRRLFADDFILNEVDLWRQHFPEMEVHSWDEWRRIAEEEGHGEAFTSLNNHGRDRQARGDGPAVMVGHNHHYIAYGQREGNSRIFDRSFQNYNELSISNPLIAYAKGDEKVGASAATTRAERAKISSEASNPYNTLDDRMSKMDIAIYMNEKGASRKEISDRLGVSTGSLSNWLRKGGKPSGMEKRNANKSNLIPSKHKLKPGEPDWLREELEQ